MAELPIQKKTTKVAIQVRENDTTHVYFVINYSHEPTLVTVTTPLTNALTGQTEQGTQAIAGYGVKVSRS